MYFKAFDRQIDRIAQEFTPAGCTAYFETCLGSFDPVVLVVLNVPENGGFAFRRTVLTWRVTDLIKEVGLTSSATQRCVGMMLLSPGHMNQTGGWKLDAISEIWGGWFDADTEVPIERYHLVDGRQLIAPRDQLVVERRELDWRRLI